MKNVPFLWEIGCEEFPAGWLPDTLAQLGKEFQKQLQQHDLGEAEVEVSGTLRRLVVHVPKLAEKELDRREQVTGPPVSIAKTESGEWSKAALGFARKNQLQPAKLKLLTTKKGEYVGFVREVKGKKTLKLLPSIMAETLRNLSFPKFMNWDAEIADGRGAFPFWKAHPLDGVPLWAKGGSIRDPDPGERKPASGQQDARASFSSTTRQETERALPGELVS